MQNNSLSTNVRIRKDVNDFEFSVAGGVEFVRPARMSRYALYPAAGPSQEPQGPSQVRQSVTTRSTRQATVPSQGVHPRATIVRPVSNPPPHYGGSMYVARPPTHSVPFASRR